MRISIDTSFLSHALIPDQRTPEAVAALRELIASDHSLVGASGVFVEFPSLLRKLITKRALTADEAGEIFEDFLGYPIAPVLPITSLQRRAWQLATRLGQSDTFDAMGYAVAEAVEGEFWTSDRRFTNAARAAGLGRVRFVP